MLMPSTIYVEKLARALRRNPSFAVNQEISGLVLECRMDMKRLGITNAKAENEQDGLIFGAVRDFCRWQYGMGNPEAERFMQNYLSRVDALRSSSEYTQEEADA